MKKLIVVSGGSRGIGKAIVEKFLNEGFEVAACSRSKGKLEELKRTVNSESLHIFKADVSIKEEAEAFGRFVAGLNVPIKALINNAGVFIPGRIFDEPEDNLVKQMNTNLYSAYYLTRSLITNLKTSESAHIFNVCSIASLMAYPASGSYSISKFAMLGFSKSIREELKNTNIKVTSVMPGATLTDSWAGVELPESRFIKSEDIAETIWAAFTLSKSAVVEEIVIRPQLGDL
jgi:short-subunit dehydrogenase